MLTDDTERTAALARARRRISATARGTTAEGSCRYCDEPSADGEYGRVHARLRRERGPASRHRCQVCGARAREWACISANPLLGLNASGRRVTYSDDLADYIPVCAPDHRALDAARARDREHAAALLPPEPLFELETP